MAKHSNSFPRMRLASRFRVSVLIRSSIAAMMDDLGRSDVLLITGVFFWFGEIKLRKAAENITQCVTKYF